MTFHLHSVGTLMLTVQLYSLASTLHFCLKWENFLFFSRWSAHYTVLCPREWRRRAILCATFCVFTPESFGSTNSGVLQPIFLR